MLNGEHICQDIELLSGCKAFTPACVDPSLTDSWWAMAMSVPYRFIPMYQQAQSILNKNAVTQWRLTSWPFLLLLSSRCQPLATMVGWCVWVQIQGAREAGSGNSGASGKQKCYYFTECLLKATHGTCCQQSFHAASWHARNRGFFVAKLLAVSSTWTTGSLLCASNPHWEECSGSILFIFLFF